MADTPRIISIYNELPEIGIAEIEYPGGAVYKYEFDGGNVAMLRKKARRTPGVVASVIKKISYGEKKIKDGTKVEPKAEPASFRSSKVVHQPPRNKLPPEPGYEQTTLFPESLTFEDMIDEAVQIGSPPPVEPRDPSQTGLLPPPEFSLEHAVVTLMRAGFTPVDLSKERGQDYHQVGTGVYRRGRSWGGTSILEHSASAGRVFLGDSMVSSSTPTLLMMPEMSSQSWHAAHPSQQAVDSAAATLRKFGYSVVAEDKSRDPSSYVSWEAPPIYMVYKSDQTELRTEAVEIGSPAPAEPAAPGQLGLLPPPKLSLENVVAELLRAGFSPIDLSKEKEPEGLRWVDTGVLQHTGTRDTFSILDYPDGGRVFLSDATVSGVPAVLMMPEMSFQSWYFDHPAQKAVNRAGDALTDFGYDVQTHRKARASDGYPHRPTPPRYMIYGTEVGPRTESLEEDQSHSYACVMGDLHTEALNIETLREKIDPKDVIEDEDPGDPHVTILYGYSDSQLAAVKKLLADELPVTGKFEKVDVFENDEHDVVILKIESAGLQALHAKLAKLPNEETHPEYIPHTTIAYVKSGEGKKYKNPETSPFWTSYGDEGKKSKPYILSKSFTIDRIIFSKQSGGEEIIRLRSKMAKDLKAPVIAAIKQANKGFENPYKPTIYINPVTGAAYVETGDWENEDQGFAPLDDLFNAIKKIDGIKSVDGESEAPPHQKEGPWEEVFINGPRLDRDKKELSEAEESMGQQFADTMEDLIGEGTVSFMGPFVIISDKGDKTATTLEMSFHPVEWGDLPLMNLGFIGVAPENRGKGNASRVLRLLTSVADKKGWRMGLDVQPTKMRDDRRIPMTKAKLTAWYKKFGFKPGRHGNMVRDPVGYTKPAEPKPNAGVRATVSDPNTEEPLKLGDKTRDIDTQAESLAEDKSDATLDSEAAQMLTQYEDEPTSIWLYTDMPVKDRMAWAYLAADAFKGVPFKDDMVRAFVAAMTKVTDPPETFWEQIKDKDKLRAVYLDQLDWDIETVPLDHIGVYPRFSGYPDEWCKGSVVDTAKRIKEDKSHPDKKAKLLQISDKYQTIMKFLPPILVPGGILRSEQPGYELTKYTADDGNHRLVAAALAGEKEAVCFVGSAKENQGPPPAAKLVPMKAESLGEAVNIGGLPPAQSPERGQQSLFKNETLEDHVREYADSLGFYVVDTEYGDGRIWSRGDRSLRQRHIISYTNPKTGGRFDAELYGATNLPKDQKLVLFRVGNGNIPADVTAARDITDQMQSARFITKSSGDNMFAYAPEDGHAVIREKKVKRIKGAPTILVVGLLPGQAERLRQKFRKAVNLVFVVEKDVSAPIPAGADWAIGLASFMSHKQDGKVAGTYGNHYLRATGGVSAVKRRIENILADKPYESVQGRAYLEAVSISGPVMQRPEDLGQQKLFGSQTFEDALDILADLGWKPVEQPTDPDTRQHYNVHSDRPFISFAFFLPNTPPAGTMHARVIPFTLGPDNTDNAQKAIVSLENEGFKIITDMPGRMWSVLLPDEPHHEQRTEAVQISGPTGPVARDPGQLSLLGRGEQVDWMVGAVKGLGFEEDLVRSTNDTVWFINAASEGMVGLRYSNADAGGDQTIALIPNFDPNIAVGGIPPERMDELLPHIQAYQSVANILQSLEGVESRVAEPGEVMGEAINIGSPMPDAPVEDPRQMTLSGMDRDVVDIEEVLGILRNAGFKDPSGRVPQRVRAATQKTGRYDWAIYAMRSPGRTGYGWVQLSLQRADDLQGFGPLDAILIHPVADPYERGRARDKSAYVLALNTLYAAGYQPRYIDSSQMLHSSIGERSSYLFNDTPTEKMREYIVGLTSPYDDSIGRRMMGEPVQEAVNITGNDLAPVEEPGQQKLFAADRVFNHAIRTLLQNGFSRTGELIHGSTTPSEDYAILTLPTHGGDYSQEDGRVLLITYEPKEEDVVSTFLFPHTAPDALIYSKADKLARDIARKTLEDADFKPAPFGHGYMLEGMADEFKMMVEDSLA